MINRKHLEQHLFKIKILCKINLFTVTFDQMSVCQGSTSATRITWTQSPEFRFAAPVTCNQDTIQKHAPYSHPLSGLPFATLNISQTSYAPSVYTYPIRLHSFVPLFSGKVSSVPGPFIPAKANPLFNHILTCHLLLRARLDSAACTVPLRSLLGDLPHQTPTSIAFVT